LVGRVTTSDCIKDLCRRLSEICKQQRLSLALFGNDQSGSYVILSAILMPVLVGTVGLGTEGGLWLYKHQTLQSAADSGALSAAVAASSSRLVNAQAVAASYGFVAGANGVTVTVNAPPLSGTHMATTNAVEVIVQQPQPRLFTAIWKSDTVPITARSVAIGTPGLGCVLALDPSASGSISVSGTAQLNLNGCNLYDNSSSGSGLSVGSNATIAAYSVSTVGGISGQSRITADQGIATAQAPAADPYVSATYPSFSGCTRNNYQINSGPVTLDPGVYCNGMDIRAGVTVTLNPGIYYIDRGSLTVNGSATLTGSGVTIVFTSSTGSSWATASINGGATINLTPPTSGTTAGIVLFGDRNMTANTAFTLGGGASQTMAGAVYLPKALVHYSGGGTAASGCTQLIANQFDFNGNAKLSVNCSGAGTKALGAGSAKLAE
jgi:Flp pilus assembly protein TadG